MGEVVYLFAFWARLASWAMGGIRCWVWIVGWALFSFGFRIKGIRMVCILITRTNLVIC